ncbi:efflux RND transporter periplasmic adaptor subunit, partial [Candidatus Parcubacteria bacterium]|nr:efflux RND transporter periplasmic adaptor subunit [Candidatus Parcubacteria bacterium]
IESDGKVIAEDGVELSFSVSGTNLEVEEVFIKEGDKIKKGDKIATVKTETLELNVRSVYSSYLSALADYNQAMDGATSEQIADAADNVTSAEISLGQAQIALENTEQSAQKSIYDAEQDLKDAKEILDDNQDELTSEDVQDAYNSLVDTVKSISITLENILIDSDEIVGVDNKTINDDYEDFLGVKDVSSMSEAIGSYKDAKEGRDELNSYALSINASSAYPDVDAAAGQTNNTLETFESHLYDMQTLLDASIVSTGLTQTELDSFKSTINTNRTTINTKITSLRTLTDGVKDAKDSLEDYIDDYAEAQIDLANEQSDAERDIENAEANVRSKELSLEQAKRDHNDLLAPLTGQESALARSRLTSASVSLQKAQNELENATIISPIDGEVARLNYKTGDIIVDNSTSDPVAVIINNDTLFIGVDIEEADINKIKVGQAVYAAFDALDGLRLDGEVSFISLTSKTNNSGIVTYLVRIVIMNKGDNQIREGMTAFVDFVTAEVKDILTVPVSAVRNVNDTPSVLNINEEWVPVVTGFTDSKNVEIISGLSAGDKIIY